MAEMPAAERRRTGDAQLKRVDLWLKIIGAAWGLVAVILFPVVAEVRHAGIKQAQIEWRLQALEKEPARTEELIKQLRVLSDTVIEIRAEVRLLRGANR